MTIKELHNELLEAYSVSNLTRISLTLINLFRTRQYSVLRKISEIISDFVSIKIQPDGKGFTRFMMLYHPDRSNIHINEINRLAEHSNFDGLLAYSHILRLERIEEMTCALNCYEDIDYSPVYSWDFDTEGFSIVTDSQLTDVIRTKTSSKLIGYNFYDAIKIREFGYTEIEYPSFYLEDIEDFELSCSDINDLDGVQFCINAKTLDLSNNRITDLSPLIGLTNLEELNLSDNQIGYIDELSTLSGLKSLQLANNMIQDISPLFGLEKLEFADLSGNNTDSKQISRLIEAGITVNLES